MRTEEKQYDCCFQEEKGIHSENKNVLQLQIQDLNLWSQFDDCNSEKKKKKIFKEENIISTIMLQKKEYT